VIYTAVKGDGTLDDDESVHYTSPDFPHQQGECAPPPPGSNVVYSSVLAEGAAAAADPPHYENVRPFSISTEPVYDEIGNLPPEEVAAFYVGEDSPPLPPTPRQIPTRGASEV